MKQRINKLDAATRQLCVAIRMFFRRDDPIAVHTLAAAAEGILHALAGRNGQSSLIRDNPVVRPEKQKEWNRLINGPQNFFKHADKDPDAEIDYESGMAEFLLFDAASLHRSLTGKDLPETGMYLAWFMAQYPEFLLPGKAKNVVTDALSKGLDPNDYDLILTVISPQSGDWGRRHRRRLS